MKAVAPVAAAFSLPRQALVSSFAALSRAADDCVRVGGSQNRSALTFA
jgi:hypothetical protein